MPRRDDLPEFPPGALVHIVKMSSSASYCDIGVVMPVTYNRKKAGQEMGALRQTLRTTHNYVDVMMMKKDGGVDIATVPKEWLVLIDDPEPEI